MSLIEEALRKQELEEGRQPRPLVPIAPPQVETSATPDPARVIADEPMVVHPDVDRQRHLNLLVLAGVGLLLLLVLAGVVMYWLAHGRGAAESQIAGVPVAPMAVSKSPIVAVVTQPPAPVVPATVAVVVTQATAPVVAVTQPAPPARPVTPVVTVDSVPVTPTQEVVTAAAALPVVPAKAEVRWPEFVVKGTFSSGGKTLVLLGDGTTLETGLTSTAGVRLQATGPGWVQVAYKGQVRKYRRNGGNFVLENGAPGAEAP